MKKLSTTIIRRIKHVAMFALLSVALMDYVSAQSPYCSVSHSATGCPTYNMYIGAIRVQQGSTIIFNKADDGCNQTAVPNYTMMSTSPSFSLSGGSNYTMSFSTGNSYNVHIAVWVDLNGDYDFSDAGEYLSTGWADITTGGSLQPRTFTLGCAGIKAGATRMRVRTDYSGSGAWNAGASCATVNYGETEDYTISLAIPSSLAAGFYMPNQAYEGTPVKMTNTNQTGYISHQWDINVDGSIDYTSVNATHIFATPGTKSVRLTSVNCLGRDSIDKYITIITPSAKPVVDFVSNTNEIERFGTVNLLDLSTNGPTYWNWYLYDPADSINSRLDVESYNFNLVGNNPNTNANPSVFFNKTGNYTVCLQTSNSKGPSSILCKPNYVRVTPFKDNNMGAGTVQPIYESNSCIIDDGGRTGPYSNNRIDYATIIPCGAKKITLTFSLFKVGAGDLLKIYDGTDASGKPLHPGTGFTKGNEPKGPIIAYSGAMYLYFSTDGSGVDSGFVACWSTEKGAVLPPVASFDIPDTLYNPIMYTFKNTSQNVLGKTDFVWSEPSYGDLGYTKDLDYAFLTDNTYDITMTASTCIGSSSYTKSVVVVTPTDKANINFSANNRRPNTGETITLTAFGSIANKAIKADMFKWTFFPGTVQYVNGTDADDRIIQVKFNAKGKYTASLRGWNSIDSATTSAAVIKADYIIVVEHCTPILGVSASADIAINNVTLTDKNNVVLINNSSTNNSNGYDDYTLTSIEANVTFGSTYLVSTSRSTNVNPMSRKVWIDWNIDGDFDDAGETVASEATATTTTFSANFTVPDISKAFEGKTRMRIGTSYSTDPNMPCGASSGIANANRVGEFEDYRIIMANDMLPPMLTLNNEDTLYLEVGSTYTEYGATAIDPTEGNISSKIVITSDLDMAFTGIYYLQYNVTDAGGNQAVPVNRVIYVVKDQTKPALTLQGKDTVRVEVFGTYTEDGATAMDNKDGNITNAIVVSGSVNTSVLGTYILKYVVNDVAGNQAVKYRIVIVEDTQKPVIVNNDANASNEVKVQILTIFVDRTKVADNYDNPKLIVTNGPGTPDGVDNRFRGTYTLVYDATDISGNKADTKTYNYIVDDYIGPAIDLNTLDTIIWPVNRAYTPVQASVSDNYYDNSQVSLTRTSNVNPYKLGIYMDTYTATDGSGNVTVRRRWVRVIDDQSPVINGYSMNVGLYSVINAAEGLSINDNYDAPTVLLPRLQILFNNLNTYKEGVYTVIFSVTDLSGNLSLPYQRTIWVSRKFETITGSVANIDKDKSLNVYPNPSTGSVNISYNFTTPETLDIQVYNSTGSLVAEVNAIHGQNGVQTIDLSKEANGLYSVRMRVNGRQITRKISIRR